MTVQLRAIVYSHVDRNHFTSATEGHAHTLPVTHTCTPGRKLALLAPMDDRSHDRRLALKSSREHGVMKMSDQNQQALFCNMFNQITMGLCGSVYVGYCLFACVYTTKCWLCRLMFSYAHMYSCSIHKVNPIASQYPAGKQMFKNVD